MDINVKISTMPQAHSFRQVIGGNVFKVSVGLDSRLQPGEQSESKWGINYRGVKDGEEIMELFVEGIKKCEGYLGMDVFRGEAKWVNAGEWTYYKKKETEIRRDNILKRAKPEDILSIKRHFSQTISKINLQGGPGLLERVYTTDSRNRLADDWTLHSKLNIEDMEEDLLLKGDRLRHVIVYFVDKSN